MLMGGLWQRFAQSLTPGVRWLLGTWALLYALAMVLGHLHIADLPGWVMLTGAQVLRGQVWRLASYALLPGGLLDLVLGGMFLAMFGGMLERVWTRRDFLLYALVSAVGAGLVKIVVQPGGALPLLGPHPVIFALMVAGAWLFPHQMMMLAPSFELTMRQTVMLMAAVSFFATAYISGWTNAVVLASGGGCGLAYLWIRATVATRRAPTNAVSGRINRLEL
jgi:membrane associated rhomboid family serine protease